MRIFKPLPKNLGFQQQPSPCFTEPIRHLKSWTSQRWSISQLSLTCNRTLEDCLMQTMQRRSRIAINLILLSTCLSLSRTFIPHQIANLTIQWENSSQCPTSNQQANPWTYWWWSPIQARGHPSLQPRKTEAETTSKSPAISLAIFRKNIKTRQLLLRIKASTQSTCLPVENQEARGKVD